MTATNNRLVWETMKSKLQAMGGVTKVVIGDPHMGIQSGMVAIIPETGSVDETVLNAPRELHTVTLRRIENSNREPFDDGEFRLDAWRAEIMEDLIGDFDLGGTVAYLLPASTTWQYGYIIYENTFYRFLDLSLTYRIDPAATLVQ